MDVLYPSLGSPFGGLKDLIYTSLWGFVAARSDFSGMLEPLERGTEQQTWLHALYLIG